MSDSIFVVTLLTTAGTLTVTSGGQSQTFNAPAGPASFSVPMQVGRQSFALARNGQNVLAGVSLRDITSVCPCGKLASLRHPTRAPNVLSDRSLQLQRLCRLCSSHFRRSDGPRRAQLPHCGSPRLDLLPLALSPDLCPTLHRSRWTANHHHRPYYDSSYHYPSYHYPTHHHHAHHHPSYYNDPSPYHDQPSR